MINIILKLLLPSIGQQLFIEKQLANTAFARAPAPPRAARASARASVRVRAASTIYDFTLKTLGGGTRDAPTDGEDLPLSRYKGKVVLINNVATF